MLFGQTRQINLVGPGSGERQGGRGGKGHDGHTGMIYNRAQGEVRKPKSGGLASFKGVFVSEHLSFVSCLAFVYELFSYLVQHFHTILV